MIKCQAVKDFTLSRFNELKNIERRKNEGEGKIFVGDKFECPEDLAKYLNGGNDQKQVVIKILEVIPEKVEEVKEEPPREIGKPRKTKRKR